MDLDAYISNLNDLAGLDLTDAQATDLVNEGRSELLCRSEFRRAQAEVGPTVTAQAAYALPTGSYRVLKLRLAGHPCFPTDQETVDRFISGSSLYSLPTGAAFFYRSHTSAGVEQVSLYPVPTTAGTSISALIVKRPDDIPASGEDPDVPLEFQRKGVVAYAAAHAQGYSEDNRDEKEALITEFEEAVGQLRSLGYSHTGRGPQQVQIAGVHV